MALPVIWDAEKCAEEVRRVADKGCHSLSFTENPAALGYPSFHDRYWDPLWAAVCDTETVLSIHLGSSGQLSFPAPDSPPRRDDHPSADEHPVGRSRPAVVTGAQGISHNSHCPVGGEAPDGCLISWSGSTAPTTCTTAGLAQDFGGRMPSEVFRQHFLTCFISDHTGVYLRNQIGIDNI